MKGIAIDRWGVVLEYNVKQWLTNAFGEQTKTTWYIEEDYDLIGLVMSEEIYTMYLLTW
jgi:hypothetical protein